MLDRENSEREGDKGQKPILGVGTLDLENFRNYDALHLEFHAGFHVVAGPNAQGKTNLLEALYLLSTTRLLRGIRDAEAIREGSNRAVVKAALFESTTEISFVIEKGTRKRAFLNTLGLPRAADLIGRMPCVCVSSADLPIVRGEPSDRRLFLDLELSQLYPSYLRHLSLYKRALEQRNALLKSAQERQVPAEVFEPWEAQMALHGAAMREARMTFVAELSPFAEQAHHQLGFGEQLSVAYALKDENRTTDELLAGLANRQIDIARGTTTIGPHRDDMAVNVEEREARLFGSQGQQRSAVISLKLATLEHARSVFGSAPLLLLDDVFSDLDAGRRKNLSKWVLERGGQTVLTCTEEDDVGAGILECARVFHVKAGKIKQTY